MNYKEMFEQWYDNQNDAVIEFKEHGNCDSWKLISLKDFYKLPPAMQQGVWLQFFRENNMDIIINVGWINEKLSGYIFDVIDIVTDRYMTLQQKAIYPDYNTAFNTAIETAGKVLEGK